MEISQFYTFHTLVLLSVVLKTTFCAFRETPASFLGEINQRFTLKCSYYVELDFRSQSEPKIHILWLKAEPQLQVTTSNLPAEFKPFYQDKNRIFIKHSRTEGDNMVTNTSTIEILESRYEDMGKYKCIINGGFTYGGEESPVADVRLTPRIFVDPTIVKLDRRKDKVEMFCDVSWPGWGTSGFYKPNQLVNTDKTSCTDTRIVWYSTPENMWVNPHDPAEMEKAIGFRRFATNVQNLNVESNGRLVIYTDPEDLYYQEEYDSFYEKEKERKLSWRQLEKELIKITGIYWCEFQYCYEKEMQYKRAQAVVKYPIRFDSEKMERNMIGFIDDNIVLECLVIGGPYYTIKWGKGNITLNTQSRDQERSSSRLDEVRYYEFGLDQRTKQPTRLILRGLQYFDRAEYFCNATSFDGNEISASIMLRVKYRFTSYIPLGVIVGQVILIFLMVFFTEKFLSHDHDRLPKHTERFSALQAMELTGSRRALNDDFRFERRAVPDTVDRNQYNTYQSAGGNSGII